MKNSFATKYLDLAFMHILFVASNIASAQTATPPSGDGSSGNPYQIATLENLCWIAADNSRWASGIYYNQTADINASETSGWGGRRVDANWK